MDSRLDGLFHYFNETLLTFLYFFLGKRIKIKAPNGSGSNREPNRNRPKIRFGSRFGLEPKPSGSVRFYPILRKNAKKRIYGYSVIVQRRAIARWNPLIETRRMAVKSSL